MHHPDAWLCVRTHSAGGSTQLLLWMAPNVRSGMVLAQYRERPFRQQNDSQAVLPVCSCELDRNQTGQLLPRWVAG